MTRLKGLPDERLRDELRIWPDSGLWALSWAWNGRVRRLARSERTRRHGRHLNPEAAELGVNGASLRWDGRRFRDYPPPVPEADPFLAEFERLAAEPLNPWDDLGS